MPSSPLERRRRRAARLALYGSLLLAGAAAVLLTLLLGRPIQTAPDAAWRQAEYENRSEVQLLQRYARIDTSAATGSELEGARFVAGILAAEGIPATIEPVGLHHANLWAILEGRNPEAIVLHHHIDVSPILDPERWDFPPFEATIEGPWIYGRGVFDMKSVAVAQLVAFLELKRSGRPLERSVVLLATGDEEDGSEHGTRWFLARHPELARRFAVVLTEGGVVEAVSRTEVKYWGIEVAQKRIVPAVACAPTLARLQDLALDLVEHGRTLGPLRLTPEVESFLRAYAPTRSWYWGRELLGRPRSLLLDGPSFGRIPPYLQALFRDEVFTHRIEGGHAGDGELRLHLELLPGADTERAAAALFPPWVMQGAAVRLQAPLGADHGSPFDHPVVADLARAVREAYPGAPVGPYVLMWRATDARFFREAGIPAYGFSPFLLLSTDTLQVDAANERIALPGFVEGVALYARLLQRLAS